MFKKDMSTKFEYSKECDMEKRFLFSFSFPAKRLKLGAMNENY